jgi:hypothetical protein
MESKQFNKPIPLFSHQEFTELIEKLRTLGCKPAPGDLVAALIHAAVQDPEATSEAVESFIRYELALEQAEGAVATAEVG